MTLTVETLEQMARQFEAVPPVPRFIFTASALKESAERLFPASKNRSKRIHKKLVKRFGGEFRKVPTMWRIGNDIYAHPALKPMLEHQIDMANALMRV